MSFTRVSILSSGALLLLQLAGCSAQPGSEPHAARDSRAQSESVDSETVSSVLDDAAAAEDTPPHQLQPSEISKWKTILTKPPVYAPEPGGDGLYYRVSARRAEVQMLPDNFPKTKVLAYAGRVRWEDGSESRDWAGSPGATFEMTRGVSARVEWLNDITTPHVLSVPPGPHSIPQAETDVPYVTHLHGLEVLSDHDGAPEAWFTHSGAKGPAFVSNVYEYPNSQPPTALWYHDHTIGMTRLNVYAGLAGMYIIRERDGETPAWLPPKSHEMPLVIQDRSFNSDGSLVYTSHGDVTVVNGKVWPEMQVDRAKYRFRVLNGANSRFYDLALPNGPKVTLIGSDGGTLPRPLQVSSLPLAPGERADILLDFSELQPGASFIMKDSTGDDVVRFTVRDSAKETGLAALPAEFTPLPELHADSKRIVTLNMADDGTYLLNGQPWHGAASEKPQLGATEDWELVNLTFEDHPIHLHLVQFRVLNRQQLDLDNYLAAWTQKNPALPLTQPTVDVDPEGYLKDSPIAPTGADTGWKDTVVVPFNTVTRIRVRWAPQDATDVAPGKNSFPFDPTLGTGYVWHCHMLEHEDNDMMRPLTLVK